VSERATLENENVEQCGGCISRWGAMARDRTVGDPIRGASDRKGGVRVEESASEQLCEEGKAGEDPVALGDAGTGGKSKLEVDAGDRGEVGRIAEP
jgi:hypothetical protein